MWGGTPPPSVVRHLPPRLMVADPVEAALDLGKASFDHRLELAVGENVGPVVLDTFTHELAYVEWVNAATDALGELLHPVPVRIVQWRGIGHTGETLRQIAPRVHDVGADDTG